MSDPVGHSTTAVPAPSSENMVAGNPFDDPPISSSQKPSQKPPVSIMQIPPQPQGAPHMMPHPPMGVVGGMRGGMMIGGGGGGPPGGWMGGYPPRGPPMYPQPPPQPFFQGMRQSLPPVHICRTCGKEIPDDGSDGIQCSVPSYGCNNFFHRNCAKLSQAAYSYLKEEPFAEWICHSCHCKSQNMQMVYRN